MNNLEELKAGDKVFISTRCGMTLQTVQRITPTGRVVVNNIQFIDGTNRSNTWNIIVLEEATEEKIKEYKIRMFVQKVFNKLRENKCMYYTQTDPLDEIFAQAKKINEILNLGVQEENEQEK